MIVSYELCINILSETLKVDIKTTRSSVAAQKSQEETGLIFLLKNVERYKRSFSIVLFYIQLCKK